MIEEKIQKVKLVGGLHQARQVVGLIKDIAMLTFLLVLIFGVIALVALTGQVKLPF